MQSPFDTDPGAQDLAREVVHFILNADHGLSPFPQSAFFQLVENSGVAQGGLDPFTASIIAENMGIWLETQGYITLGTMEADNVCDCANCCRSILVTESGIAFAAELNSPPWETN